MSFDQGLFVHRAWRGRYGRGEINLSSSQISEMRLLQTPFEVLADLERRVAAHEIAFESLSVSGFLPYDETTAKSRCWSRSLEAQIANKMDFDP